MSIDFRRAEYIRQYRDEQGEFRALPLFTKALASYLGVLVDPLHGWLHLGGQTVTCAVLTHCTGAVTRAQRAMLPGCLQALLRVGHLQQCEVLDVDFEPFTTTSGRPIPLSPWAENAEGDCIVVANWIPAQHGMSREETAAWHAARQERIAQALATATAARVAIH